MILEVLVDPDPRLRTRARPVDDPRDVKTLVEDMFDTMRHNNAVGLAATQVDCPVRVIVLAEGLAFALPSVFINPEIVYKDNAEVDTSDFERCISSPGEISKRRRSNKITVRYLNSLGRQEERDFNGLTSIVIQHEVDHLNGILLTDSEA